MLNKFENIMKQMAFKSGRHLSINIQIPKTMILQKKRKMMKRMKKMKMNKKKN